MKYTPIIVVFVVCLISMTAILSDYAGALKLNIGPSGIQLQIGRDTHPK